MKIKALLATLVGAVAINGATAGEWCPPAPDKCPVDCCPESAGSISVGYMSDYLFYGARLAEDSVWTDLNYTFTELPLPVTVGVWYLSEFGNNGAYGDEADFYASVGLPSMLGLDASFGYTVYTYPTGGYSQHEISLELSRELFAGFTASYRAAYDFNMWQLGGGAGSQQGAWMHHFGLAKTIDISDCIGLELSGGVLYSDNYWNPALTAGNDNTGWNNYYLQAALPITVGCTGTLTPYIGYNGSPDGWVLDGANLGGAGAARNYNDLLHWGVSFGVEF